MPKKKKTRKPSRTAFLGEFNVRLVASSAGASLAIMLNGRPISLMSIANRSVATNVFTGLFDAARQGAMEWSGKQYALQTFRRGVPGKLTPIATAQQLVPAIVRTGIVGGSIATQSLPAMANLSPGEYIVLTATRAGEHEDTKEPCCVITRLAAE